MNLPVVLFPKRDNAVEWAIRASGSLRQEEILANSLTEFDEEEFIRDIHQEGYDEGFSNGISQGTRQKAVENARNLLTMNLLSHEQIAQAVDLPLEKVKELAEQLRMQNA